MEEIRQIYQTISDYVTNPTFLKVATGVMVIGTAICFGYSIKLIKMINRIGKKEESKGLEEKL